ncbi:MAG: sugar phosphate isomerase/epimerase [Candidatus Latescibacteria bacterium]|nr:sugar phosphate isomerase/epimerase [Candidatus Latescibacterota bacterium]
MQLGYSTWGMPTVPLERAVPHLAALGYDGIELTVIPGYTTELSTLVPSERRWIRRAFQEHHLALPAIAAHSSLLETDPDRHATNMARLRAAVDLAADLTWGDTPPAVNTTPGGGPDEWDGVKGRLVEETRTLVEYAASSGVTIAMEPHVGASINSPERVLWLIEQVGSPYLRVNFDISHFDVVGLTIEETVPVLAPYSAHTHVKDQRGRHPDFEFLIPGEGTFDYVRYLKAMQAAGYEKFITVEVSVMVQRRPEYDPFAAAELSYRTLSAAFEQAGIERR